MADNQRKTGRLTNPPQHSFGAYGEGVTEVRAPDGLPSRADPHPSEEENPYRAPHPGGVHSKHDINRVNDAVTDGQAGPRPQNAENDKRITPGS
jgi:hypothetical protein